MAKIINTTNNPEIFVLWTQHSSKKSRDDVSRVLENKYDIILIEGLIKDNINFIHWLKSPFFLSFMSVWKVWSEFNVLLEITEEKQYPVATMDYTWSELVEKDWRWYDYIIFIFVLLLLPYISFETPWYNFAWVVSVFCVFAVLLKSFSKSTFIYLCILLIGGSLLCYIWVFNLICYFSFAVLITTLRLIFQSTRDKHFVLRINEEINKWNEKILVVCWMAHAKRIKKQFTNVTVL